MRALLVALAIIGLVFLVGGCTPKPMDEVTPATAEDGGADPSK